MRLSAIPATSAPLATAIRPPLVSPNCIRRPGFGRFDSLLSRQVTTVVAAAGAGKTTLLAQWYDDLPVDAVRIWLTFDSQVREPAAFLSHLEAALRVAIADEGRKEYAANDPARTFCNRLADIAARRQNVYLLLDDVQNLATPSVAELLGYVLRHSPVNVHWILAGRMLPAINTAEFALREQLGVISAAQLDFDPEQIALAAEQFGCHGFNDDDAHKLFALTEGWVAGVRFALRARRHNGECSQHDDLKAFFDTVLDGLPGLIRDFLIFASLVERIEADLCDEMLGTDVSIAHMDYLERANLFARRIDADAHRLRLHPMFRDHLRRTLKREHPERIPGLHLRASHWYARRAEFESALTHAFAAGDREWCVHLTAAAARHWVKTGAIALALEWTGRFERDELFAHEHLWTAHSVCLIVSRRFVAATDLLADAVKRKAATDKVRTLKLMLALLSNRTADLESEADAIVDCDEFTCSGSELTGTLMNLQAYWLFRHQRFDAARRRALQAREWLESQGSLYGATHANAVLCAALGAVNQNRLALEHSENLYVRAARGPRNPAWANAAITLAQVRYEQNRLSDASELCQQALPLLSGASAVQGFAAAHFVWARVQAAAGNHRASEQLLDDLHGYLETGNFPLLLADVCFEKIRLYAQQDRHADLDTVSAEFDLDGRELRGEWCESASSDAAAERLACAQILRLLQVGRYDRCRVLIGSVLPRAARAGFAQRQTLLTAYQALVASRLHDQHSAYRALNEALGLLRGSGFTRGLYDDVPGLDRLFAHAASNGKLPELPRDYFTNYASVLGAIAQPTRVATRRSAGNQLQTRLEPLTDREIDVLRLLSQGLSNQQICERSNIAITTAKWHLKNIFAKLEVGSRTAALARARTLRLVE